MDYAAGSVLKCEPLAVGAVYLAPGRLVLAEVKPREKFIDFVVEGYVVPFGFD